MKLQLIESNQYNPYLNLAVENYLFDDFKENTVTMYLWKNDKTVVIGANQNPYSECNHNLLSDDGGFLMRRTTGGGAVYHDLGNINFTFIADKNIHDLTKQFRVIQTALQDYGIETETSGRNDLVYRGRKFSGNAFINSKLQSLHHGTILIKTDIESINKYLIVDKTKLRKHGVESVKSRVVNLSEIADVTSENIVPHLVNAFKTVYGHDVLTLDFDDIAKKEEVRQRYLKYSSKEFIFGHWDQFKATISHTFNWGKVDIDISVNTETGNILDIEIATDSLRPDSIAQAKTILLDNKHNACNSIVGDEVVDDIVALVRNRM